MRVCWLLSFLRKRSRLFLHDFFFKVQPPIFGEADCEIELYFVVFADVNLLDYLPQDHLPSLDTAAFVHIRPCQDAVVFRADVVSY